MGLNLSFLNKLPEKFYLPIAIIIFGILVGGTSFFTLRSLDSINLKSSPASVEPTPGASDPNQPSDSLVSTNIDDDAVLGNLNTASVAIVEFSDYECPYCKAFHGDVLNSLITQYIDTGKVVYVFRDFPVRATHGEQAFQASYAAECVHDLGGDQQFFTFSARYYEETLSNGDGLPDGVSMQDLAQEVGIDQAAFEECLTQKRFAEEVNADFEAGRLAGVSGTPAFVIGKIDSEGNVSGVIVKGAQNLELFQSVIESQLAK